MMGAPVRIRHRLPSPHPAKRNRQTTVLCYAGSTVRSPSPMLPTLEYIGGIISEFASTYMLQFPHNPFHASTFPEHRHFFSSVLRSLAPPNLRSPACSRTFVWLARPFRLQPQRKPWRVCLFLPRRWLRPRVRLRAPRLMPATRAEHYVLSRHTQCFVP